MVDADSMIPEGSVTVLAIELDHTMASNPVARAAYQATWGVEWTALTSDYADKSYAPSTTLGTVR